MNNIKDFNTADKKNNTALIITIIILFLAAGILGFLFFDQKTKNEKIINSLTEEKVELTNEYESLLSDYEELETGNDSITTQLAEQKAKVQELIAALTKTKSQNRSEIQKYKKELKTLRDIMKGFIHTIDSLNTLNIELTEENTKIKNQYNSAKKENKQLTEKYEDATDKIELASVIKAVNVELIPYNHKGKVNNKARKVKRFGVSFKLDENVIAPQGLKKLFIRITDSKKHVLMTKDQEMFTYEGEEIAFSAFREVEYKGETVAVNVYYEILSSEPIEKGMYNVDIFCDGNMIGSSSAEIK